MWDRGAGAPRLALGLDLGEVGHVRHVLPLGAGRGGKPGVEDLLELGLAGGPQAQREDVGVVPLAGALGGWGIPAQGGADAADLVGRDRRSGARPAADDALFRAA